MNIEGAILASVRVEVAKAVEEEIEMAQNKIRDRISEIAARVPIRVIKENNMRELKSVYSVIVDSSEEKLSALRG